MSRRLGVRLIGATTERPPSAEAAAERVSAALDEVERRTRESLEVLTRRADEADAALRQGDERYVGLAVHSTERANALTDRVTEAEDRLAALEIDAARLREAVRRLRDDARPAAPATGAPGSADEVDYWRRRLGRDLAEDGATTLSWERYGPVARVASDVGALLFPAQDEVMLSFLRQHGHWEQEESDQLRALLKPGMAFVDIGAHVGYMSLLAGAAVGPTGRGFAFEPEPANFRLLMANLANHGIGNVEAVPAAAWCESGRLSLSLCVDNTGDHRAYPLPGRDTVDVLALALDDVLPRDLKVDVVKVDAQATDDIAIRGMERTLARSRPVLLVEFWPDGIAQRGGGPMDVLECYRGLRYDVSVLGRPPHGASTPLEEVLDAAVSSPTAFCTLLLTPSE